MTRLTHEKPELRDQRSDMPHLKPEQAYNGVNFSALFQAIPLPVYIWQKRGNDFVLIEHNKASEAFTKGIIASLVGNKVSEMYSDMPDVLEDFSRCFTEKKSIRREMHYKMRTTGENKHFAVWYAYVPPDIVLVHTEDIDKRKLAEEALNTYKQIVSAVNDLMSCIDKNYRYLAVNDAYLKAFPGKLREDIIGITPADLFGEASFRDKIKPNTDRCFKGEMVNHQDEFEFPGIGKRYMDVSYYPVFAKGKSVSGIVHISRDITERRLVEEALRESEGKLERRVEARTSELLKTTKELQNRQEELLRNKLEVEKVNQELLDTNNAIFVLARNIDKNREESEKKIARIINSNIMPIIENLKKQKKIRTKTELDVVVAYLNDISSNLLKGIDIIVRLSSAEMRIAAMIKNGLTSKEIAEKLCISLDTVKTHRRNIRKKLRIHESNINLANYLRHYWSLDQMQ